MPGLLVRVLTRKLSRSSKSLLVFSTPSPSRNLATPRGCMTRPLVATVKLPEAPSSNQNHRLYSGEANELLGDVICSTRHFSFSSLFYLSLVMHTCSGHCNNFRQMVQSTYSHIHVFFWFAFDSCRSRDDTDPVGTKLISNTNSPSLRLVHVIAVFPSFLCLLLRILIHQIGLRSFPGKHIHLPLRHVWGRCGTLCSNTTSSNC